MSVDELSDGQAKPDADAEVLASPTPARPRRSTRHRLLIAGVVVLAVLGAGLAGGLYYVDSIPTPSLSSLPSSTTITYSDGSVLARIGSFDVTLLGPDELLPVVKQAAVAADDPDFWTSGTGAITRSVVRRVTETEGTTTAAKARLAVQAWKLDDRYSKDEILAYYLNATPFGRLTYGIEAAARVYFGKTARAAAPLAQQLTAAEAMFLLALVRQPYPDPENEAASPGFDPAAGALAKEKSQHRWAEIRDEMVALNYLTSDAAAAAVYPEALAPPSGPPSAGLSAPVGLVVNHVLDEITHTDGSAFRSKDWNAIANGGYSITTTIDPRVQQALEQTADETVAGSAMNGQPSNLQAAGAVVEPGTGRVLAYFGGHEGLGTDYAGFYYDEKGEAVGVGRYPPGASFLPYTLAAALKAGISLRSRWQWTPHDQPGRPRDNLIRNTSACTSDAVARTGACSLVESVAQSLNVPLYDVTVSVTPAKVLEMARDAGIDSMWTDDRQRQDLRAMADLATLTPAKFDFVLGIGQYPVTVLDQANGMATFAAGGLRAAAHFVKQVKRGNDTLFSEQLPYPNAPRLLTAGQIADLTYALTSSPGATPNLAVKTGVWEYAAQANQNAHAWSLAYTQKLAIAVHVGNRSDEKPLVDRNGYAIWGSGLPSTIMRKVMTDSQNQLGLTPTPFAPPVFGGQLNPPGSVPG